jgi:hypothetical protein
VRDASTELRRRRHAGAWSVCAASIAPLETPTRQALVAVPPCGEPLIPGVVGVAQRWRWWGGTNGWRSTIRSRV